MPEYAEVTRRLSAIEQEQQKVRAELTEHRDSVDSALADLRKHLDRQDDESLGVKNALLGSFDKSEPGLVERVRIIGAQVSGIASRHKSSISFWQAIVLAIIGSAALVLFEFVSHMK